MSWLDYLLEKLAGFPTLTGIIVYSAEYLCGGSYTAAPGYITSPSYPDNYGPSLTCIYDIGWVIGSKIGLHIGRVTGWVNVIISRICVTDHSFHGDLQSADEKMGETVIPGSANELINKQKRK